MANDDGFKPYWLDEKDWLVAIVGDDPVELDWTGRMLAFTYATDTRMLALVGDPEGPLYELLFSFSTEENKQRFLELVEVDGYADPSEEDCFMVPAQDEIKDARPLGMVFSGPHLDRINRVATITAAGLESSENPGATIQ